MALRGRSDFLIAVRAPSFAVMRHVNNVKTHACVMYITMIVIACRSVLHRVRYLLLTLTLWFRRVRNTGSRRNGTTRKSTARARVGNNNDNDKRKKK